MENPEPYSRFIGSVVEVEIDRPLGSKHPDWDLWYDVNYGYLPGTLAGDGEPIDAYVLGVETPIQRFRGPCVAVILRHDDNEHKLVVAPGPMSRERILQETTFVEKFYDGAILVFDPE